MAGAGASIVGLRPGLPGSFESTPAGTLIDGDDNDGDGDGELCMCEKNCGFRKSASPFAHWHS